MRQERKSGPSRHQPQIEAIRCPFCVKDNEFRAMVDLTGGASGIYYCTGCRHLVRTSEPTFRCLCANCRNVPRSQATA